MPATPTLIDAGFVVVVAFAALGGWRRGGAALALHVVGVVLGLVVGLRLAPSLVGSLHGGERLLAVVGCGLGGLLVGGALGRLVGRWVSSGIARVHLTLLDRLLGAAARGAVAVVVCWLALAAILAFGPMQWATPIRRATLADPARIPAVAGVERTVTRAAPRAADLVRCTVSSRPCPAGHR